jgi:secretion/DNA translocation related CpaE-like protein
MGSASTFAAAVALQAAANETVTLVDADPIGGGLDLLLGAEAVPGARWADLGDCRGVVAAAALTATLPVVGGMTLLSFGRGAARVLPDAMEAVLAAAARGSDLVVVDLPRGPDAAAERVAGAAALVVLVVPATVRAVAAAGPSIERWSAGGAEMALAVRHPGPADLTPAAVASAVGLPLLTVVPGDRRLADLTDRGRFVHGLHRSPVAAAAAAVVRTRRSAIAA